MGLWHTETTDRVPFEIEFDQHDRLPADDPAVMPRVDRHNLGSPVLDDTTVGVFDVDLAADEEPDVRVHAEIRPDNRLHVNRPAESGRIHHALDARRAGTSNLEADGADLPKLGPLHRREKRI